MSKTPKRNQQRRIRFVATYWIQDPGKWAQTFGGGIARQEAATIHTLRVKLKHRPHRNACYPYFVSLTARIGDKAKAIEYMKHQRTIAARNGVEMQSVTNCWLETTIDCNCATGCDCQTLS